MTEARALFARLDGRVTCLGHVAYDHLPSLYAGADLLVWPAIKEALGMCFLEAQAAGTPVVGASRPGVADLIRDGETGLLPAYGDASAFAHAIVTLTADRPRLETMRAAASRHAAANHDLASAGPRFAALVASLVKTP
jgi:glycosyltransferase involved in cell wall biosynthesis